MPSISDGDLVSQNVRLLLWQREIPRSDWIRYLASRLPHSWGAQNVSHLLNAQELEDLALGDVATVLEIEENTLRWEDLVSTSDVDVLNENLSHLLGTLEHGGKKKLAVDLGIDPTTISRWLSGAINPQELALKRLSGHFGLPAETDLRVEPVFLSLEPISFPERRKWLHQQIDDLTASELRDLFPALRRIFGPR